MIKKFYTITIIILILVAVFIFIKQYSDYEYQIEKINNLEKKRENKDKKIEYYRDKTKPCHIENLNNPRSCYFNSNYKCSWSEKANRCNKK